MKWRVELEPKCKRQLEKDFKEGRITIDDVRVFKNWVLTIEEYGPEMLLEIKKWDDHPLQKEWFGYRASSFSLKGRIIYKIVDEKIIVEVVKITPSHDYKRT